MSAKSILLTGVGGQGTILASKIITEGLIRLGYDVKMSEIHGMSQRGGSVTTQIRYGEKVYAPNIGIGEADIIIAFEKAEALRMLPYLKTGGTLITDEFEISPVPVLVGQAEYPHGALDVIHKVLPNVYVIPAAKVAKELGGARSQNIVLLGALVRTLGLSGIDWSELVAEMVPARSVDINLKAYDAGYAM
jgi:indolepyruvate ferredoxin oxidoreductase beta subunit